MASWSEKSSTVTPSTPGGPAFASTRCSARRRLRGSRIIAIKSVSQEVEVPGSVDADNALSVRVASLGFTEVWPLWSPSRVFGCNGGCCESIKKASCFVNLSPFGGRPPAYYGEC